MSLQVIDGGKTKLDARRYGSVPGAVVVLFNPTEAHVQNLSRLRQLCEHIVAVDNSWVLKEQLHDEIRRMGVEVIANQNRGGIAGAYNRGIDRLIERDCDIFFIFDQDSAVPENYFQKMVQDCDALENRLYLVGPKVFDINVKHYLPAHVVERFRARPVPISHEDLGMLPCSSVISSGSVLSEETYRRLGPFPEGYFIDHVDTEYSFRAVSRGVPVYVNTAVTLKHELGKRNRRKVLFFRLTQWDMIPLRQYYSARNCILVAREYGAKFPILTLINVITVLQVISIVLFEKDKRKKMTAMMVGVWDGVRRKYGSFESRWPRVFTFCTKTS